MSSITESFGSKASSTSAAATEGVAFEKLNVTYSIQPVKSLISSSELIVDYMADKIEQSVSIQQIFNELLRFFETEAVCLGPSFRTSKEISTAVKTEGVALSAPLGAPERKAFESFASEGGAFENLTSKEQKKISIATLNTEDSPGISNKQSLFGVPHTRGHQGNQRFSVNLLRTTVALIPSVTNLRFDTGSFASEIQSTSHNPVKW